MNELDQIREVVAMVYSLDLTPMTAINAIATILDGGELLTQGTAAGVGEVASHGC